MIRDRTVPRLPSLLAIVLALLLMIVPLPDAVGAFRPDWVTLTLIYLILNLPRSYGVGRAWMIGIVLDVARGTLLGQHALALCFVAYLTVRFHLQLRQFPLSQLTATVFALLALYQFILFWINGVAGVHATAATYWGPVLSGTVVWPLLSMLLAGLHQRGGARA